MVNVVLMVEHNPDPKTQSIVFNEQLVPIFTGDGDANYLCGECGFTIAEKVRGAQLTNLVMQCPRCKTHNRTRT